MLSLTQLGLLHRNAPDLKLSRYISYEDLFLLFLTHSQEFFETKGVELLILNPLFEDDAGKSESTSIGVDGNDFGQLFYLVDDFNKELTFFFYSEEFSFKHFFIENQCLSEVSINTYCFWLNSLYEFYKSFITK